MTMVTCAQCGEDFMSNASRVQRFCQRSCKERNAADRRRAPARKAREERKQEQQLPRTCAQCGCQYAGRRWRYCSEQCAAQAKRRRNLERYGTTIDAADRCGQCGSPVEYKRKRCDACIRGTVRDARRRHKARRRSAPTERYTLAEIARRDRYRCGLCRKRVAMTQAVPHPKAPTIDHVLPLAHGGEDTRANVQLAHFICNSTKGSSGTQQLALVG